MYPRRGMGSLLRTALVAGTMAAFFTNTAACFIALPPPISEDEQQPSPERAPESTTPDDGPRDSIHSPRT